MSNPVVSIKGLSKAYMIGHEQQVMGGTMTFRDTLTNLARKPVEIFSGHQLKKEKFWALKNLNLDINQGEVIGIIGRNGSGKSTLLKILSRIVEPTEGEITMQGRVASLLEVGTGFHPELTGRENVYFNGAILGMSRKEIKLKFDEIVAFSEVEKFLDTPVKYYSSGMYVRLAFAVAAHLDPDILIVDEVLAVGDAAFQKKCLGKMKDVAGQGRTVLFVSHNLGTVQQLCDTCIVMAKGKILKHGPTDDVIAYYEQAEDLHENFRKFPVDSTKPLSIKQVKVMHNETATNSLSFGEFPTVEVTVVANEDIKKARLAIGISAAAGMPIRTVWGSETPLVKGEYRYTAEFSDIQLGAGNYSIALGTTADGASIQNISDSLNFAVLTSSQATYNGILDRGTGSGFIKNQLKIEQVSLAKKTSRKK